MTEQTLTQREIRARNYALKKANGFRCCIGGCPNTHEGTLVVRYDGKLAVACETHAQEADSIEPHQWDEAARREAAAAKANKRR